MQKLSQEQEELKKTILLQTGQYDIECVTVANLKRMSISSLDFISMFNHILSLDLFTFSYFIYFYFIVIIVHLIKLLHLKVYLQPNN